MHQTFTPNPTSQKTRFLSRGRPHFKPKLTINYLGSNRRPRAGKLPSTNQEYNREPNIRRVFIHKGVYICHKKATTISCTEDVGCMVCGTTPELATGASD